MIFHQSFHHWLFWCLSLAWFQQLSRGLQCFLLYLWLCFYLLRLLNLRKCLKIWLILYINCLSFILYSPFFAFNLVGRWCRLLQRLEFKEGRTTHDICIWRHEFNAFGSLNFSFFFVSGYFFLGLVGYVCYVSGLLVSHMLEFLPNEALYIRNQNYCFTLMTIKVEKHKFHIIHLSNQILGFIILALLISSKIYTISKISIPF